MDSEDEKERAKKPEAEREPRRDSRAVSATMMKGGRVADVIALCLHVNPGDRPGLKELLQCPAFDLDSSETTHDAAATAASFVSRRRR